MRPAQGRRAELRICATVRCSVLMPLVLSWCRDADGGSASDAGVASPPSQHPTNGYPRSAGGAARAARDFRGSPRVAGTGSTREDRRDCLSGGLGKGGRYILSRTPSSFPTPFLHDSYSERMWHGTGQEARTSTRRAGPPLHPYPSGRVFSIGRASGTNPVSSSPRIARLFRAASFSSRCRHTPESSKRRAVVTWNPGWGQPSEGAASSPARCRQRPRSTGIAERQGGCPSQGPQSRDHLQATLQ